MSQATELIAQQMAQAANTKKVWGTIIFNVKDLIYAGGAVGNGTTDDTSAVQAAINDAVSKNATLVFFPPGTYKVTTLTNTSTINFVGDNATFVGYVGTITEFGVGVRALSLLTDVDVTLPPTNGQYLAYNSSSAKWKPITPTSTLVYNVKDYGAKGDGTTNDTSKIADAITAATTLGGIVFFPPGTYITGNQTFPSNVTIEFSNGAKLSINTGTTVTINGPVDAGMYQIFSGLGVVNGLFKVPQFYPSWWGAVGDGTADDTTAIKAAVAAVKASNSGLGGKLYFPAGWYNISDTIVLDFAINVVGAGMYSTLIRSSALDRSIFRITGPHTEIDNLSFIYTSIPTLASNAIEITQSARLTDIFIRNAYNGIACLNTNSVFMNNISIADYTNIGLFVQSCGDIYMDRFVFNAGVTTRGALGGIRLVDRCEAVVISNGDILGGAFSITTDANSYTVNNRPAYCRFHNVYFDSSLNGALISKMVSTRFSQCWFSNRPGDGCDINNCEDIVFEACEFTNNGGHGCNVTASAVRMKFLGCSFISNNSSNTGKLGLGLYAGMNDFVIQNCTFTNSLGFTGLQQWGVLLNVGASDRYIIADNLVSGNVVGGVSDGGTGVNKRVANNY